MNISYSWLKDLISIELAPELLADKLTRVGLAVEGVHAHGDDFVLDIDLTSNRPDCLSHLGIAREIGVVTNSDYKVPNLNSSDHSASAVSGRQLVRIVDPDLCHRFTARIIRNVKIGLSPEWLVKRLEAIGERSINNVADITNYVMHELGQPMHAFDLDRLAENRIVVRRFKRGERIQTLDEAERKLDESMLVIGDAEKPVALGGIMGGLNSSITKNTVNVLLEVAYFDRQNIRQTSRKLNLTTEASYRFERGVDIENLIPASSRAAALIEELAGGELGEFADVYPNKHVAAKIASDDISAAVKRLTGVEISEAECLQILGALGFNSKNDFASAKVYTVPTWRHDVGIEEDLVEEVARHTGYKNIAEELPPTYGAGEYQPTESRKRSLRQTLADMGFNEAVSYSFIDTKFDEMFDLVPGILEQNTEEKFITLRDAVIEGAVRMRPTNLPGLLDALRLNFNHQRRDIKLFEIGKVFAARSGEEVTPAEQELLSLVISGGETLGSKATPVRELDFYDVKGALEAALRSIGISELRFGAAEVKHLRNGQAAVVSIAEKSIGYIGRLNDDISATYKFRQPVFLAEADLGAALEIPVAPAVCKPLSKYPAITRDVSLVVKRIVSFDRIRSAITEQGRELCRNVSFVDVFEGSGLAEDERSITIRLEYRSDERTLMESEIEELHADLIGDLERRTGVKQRI